MSTNYVNTVIVGGGHCGVNMGCMLEANDPDRSYIILEKHDILLPAWKYARWEGFQFNTLVRWAQLHGENLTDDTLDRPIEQDIARWNAHIEKMNLKYKVNALVESVTRQDDGNFCTKVVINDEMVTYMSKNVVACNGNYSVTRITSDEGLAKTHEEIKQLVPAGLKMSDLQPGGVLVVGSGQTGVQLADLFSNTSHKPVALCTSKVAGAPRAYRGKDLFYWFDKADFLMMPKEALKGMPPDEAQGLRYGRDPIVGAVKPISAFSLHRQGVEILGGLDSFQDTNGDCEALIKANRAENIQASVADYQNILGMCIGTAEKLEKDGQVFDPAVPEPEWEIETDDEKKLCEENGPATYNLSEKGIANVIWATGHTTDFSWLKIPEVFEEFDERTSKPDALVSEKAPGLFFAGFPWLRACMSTNIVGFDKDQEVILASLRND